MCGVGGGVVVGGVCEGLAVVGCISKQQSNGCGFEQGSGKTPTTATSRLAEFQIAGRFRGSARKSINQSIDQPINAWKKQCFVRITYRLRQMQWSRWVSDLL